MATQKQLTILLKSIAYAGDNIGDDIALDLTVGGNHTQLKKQIKSGTTKSIQNRYNRGHG